jgi:hypothetical protein
MHARASSTACYLATPSSPSRRTSPLRLAAVRSRRVHLQASQGAHSLVWATRPAVPTGRRRVRWVPADVGSPGRGRPLRPQPPSPEAARRFRRKAGQRSELRSGKCKQPNAGGRAAPIGPGRAAPRPRARRPWADRPRGRVLACVTFERAEIVIEIDFRCGAQSPACLPPSAYSRLTMRNKLINASRHRTRRPAARGTGAHTDGPRSQPITAVLTGMPQKRVPSSHARLPALTP